MMLSDKDYHKSRGYFQKNGTERFSGNEQQVSSLVYVYLSHPVHIHYVHLSHSVHIRAR